MINVNFNSSFYAQVSYECFSVYNSIKPWLIMLELPYDCQRTPPPFALGLSLQRCICMFGDMTVWPCQRSTCLVTDMHTVVMTYEMYHLSTQFFGPISNQRRHFGYHIWNVNKDAPTSSFSGISDI